MNSDFKHRLMKELEYINFPEKNWIKPSQNQFDVVIIGAGMAGLTVALALKKLGCAKIKIFDQSAKGAEGPWVTYARMPTLRSGKDLVGPAHDIPLLTFRAWYEAHFGEEKWKSLRKIPTPIWMDYLNWFREVLNLEVANNQVLKEIHPSENGLHLIINDQQISTRKVILATGRSGFGGSRYPTFTGEIPQEFYTHTNEMIDFERLRNKKVGIIGGGAAGFDAAAAAIEAGVSHVDIILRREELPYVNKGSSLVYSGFFEGYHLLDDEKRWKLMEACYRKGISPPFEAVEKIIKDPKFSFQRSTQINHAKGFKVYLETNNGTLEYDFLVFATGYEIDMIEQPELRSFADKIRTWSDQGSIQTLQGPS